MRFAAIALVAYVGIDPGGWDRFGPLRFALLSTLALAAIAASLGEASFRERPLPRWVSLGWLLLLGGLSVSTVLSPDRLYSVIGTPDRHFGLLTWLVGFGLFTTASLRAGSSTRPVLRALTVGTLVTGGYAGFELAGVDWFDQGFADDRVGGTFGQPAFLGAAMLLGVPSAAATALDYSERARWRLVGVAATGLGLVALVGSQARAAWIGFAFAAAFVLVAQRRRLLTRFGAVRTGILAVVAIGLVVALSTLTFVGERAWTLTEVDEGVVAGRVDEWRVGARALAGAPLLGVIGHGPEAYRTVFGEYVDEAYVVEYGRTTITDRAHNSLLDTALAGGIVGGLGIGLLQIGLVVECARRLNRGPVDTALAAAVLGYVVGQFFLFPLAELDPILWLVAGLVVGRASAERATARRPLVVSVPRSRQLLMLAAGFGAAFAAIAGVTDVVADHRVDSALSADDAVEALDLSDQARRLRPDSIRYDFLAARIARTSGDENGLRDALERLDDGLDTSPDDPALRVERAGVLLDLARTTDAPDDLLEALRELEARDTVDPNHPLTQQQYGIALALAERPDAAIAELEHAVALAPGAVEPLVNLAVVQFESGDVDAGAETLIRAEALAPTNATLQNLRREFLTE